MDHTTHGEDLHLLKTKIYSLNELFEQWKESYFMLVDSPGCLTHHFQITLVFRDSRTIIPLQFDHDR